LVLHEYPIICGSSEIKDDATYPSETDLAQFVTYDDNMGVTGVSGSVMSRAPMPMNSASAVSSGENIWLLHSEEFGFIFSPDRQEEVTNDSGLSVGGLAFAGW